MKRQCDTCGTTGTSKTIHGIRTVKGMNDHMLFFCKKCWAAEMEWRKIRNPTLPLRSRYPVKPWRD